VKPFRERNPVTVGVVGIAAIAMLLVAAFRAEDLPLVGGGDTYYAAFSEAGGLEVDDEVRVAGVRVGKVRDISLRGDEVLVEFVVDRGTDLGRQTGADIRIKTLLGSMYLALDPAGGGELEPDSEIPVERTTAPYDVVEAFSGLASTTDRIDVDQLSTSLDTLTGLMDGTPKELRGTLKGLSRLSRNVAARDQQINTLLQNAEKVSGVLADRDEELTKLFRDGDRLIRAVYARREAVSRLLDSTRQLSQELTTLIRQSRADLKPALRQLDQVLDVLVKNQENLDESLRQMGPFYRVFANVLGNGPWFDTYVQNLVVPAPEVRGGGRR
jgi:phospholipid/cholesterol/gamma-HCH transport system substrate-binding protein